MAPAARPSTCSLQLPREDIPHLLLRPGDFLLRQSETAAGRARQLIFSVMRTDNGASALFPSTHFSLLLQIKHVIVKRNAVGKWATDNTRPFFDCVQELVNHYVHSRESIVPHVSRPSRPPFFSADPRRRARVAGDARLVGVAARGRGVGREVGRGRLRFVRPRPSFDLRSLQEKCAPARSCCSRGAAWTSP